jgi:hypothetical protein
MERLYVATQENHEREYIRTLCMMLWTVVYMGIDYEVQGKKIDEWEVMEKKGMDEKCDMMELLLLLKGTSERSRNPPDASPCACRRRRLRCGRASSDQVCLERIGKIIGITMH